MKIRDVMTPAVQCVSPDDNLVEAAGVMRDLDVGAVPVCEQGTPVGMLTDRDITVRAVAQGYDPAATKVREVMSSEVILVHEDDSVDSLVQLMERHQIRRVPVLTRDERLAGIVSLGDLAVDANTSLSAEALREVSRPSAPVR
jgi:CBS domain-containing protein